MRRAHTLEDRILSCPDRLKTCPTYLMASRHFFKPLDNYAMHRIARIFSMVLCAAAVLGSSTAQSTATDAFVILPETVELSGPLARQQLIAERAEGSTFRGQVTSGITWESSDPSVVKVTAGVAEPVGDGVATVTARNDAGKASARVVVSGTTTPADWEFRRHFLPVIAKKGCNSGACHGALAGKGGFKLSLRGYDPLGDYDSITREARGRRIELSDPGRSLILAKPSGVLPHKGGFRLEPDSRDYAVIAGWITGGAKPPRADDAELVRVEVLPPSATLAPGDDQQLIVQATYRDDRVEDVTRWAKYTSSNESVAQVDEDGRVKVMGRGVGAIVVWFSSQIVLSHITSPFDNEIDANVFTAAPRQNFVDKLVLDRLEQLRLEPSPRCDDATFVRRAFLDTIGTLPTPAEVTAFLDSNRSRKRARLIESLLSRPEFVDYWTYRWCDVFLVNGKRLRPAAVKAYYQWIHDHVAANTPWDVMASEVVTARGFSLENGETNFYALHQAPEDMAENVSQAFLGLSIGCAKCHNHPLEKWTNDQYYAMANLFARVRVKGWGGDGRSGDGKRTLYLSNTGELTQPLTGRPQPPAPLDAEPLDFGDPADRREYLADWLTSPDNPYFGRAIANRIWANFMGVGLVEQVDDLRVSNPASNEALLAALADYLADNDYDLKSLMRVILESETYQRSSKPTSGNRQDERFYARYYPRRLMAEVLLDAISQATDVPTAFTQIGYDGADFEETKEYPAGTRAIQLRDSAVVSEFLGKFGRHNRDIVCECERSNKPSMVQVLHISNGDTINSKLKAERSCVQSALAAKKSDAQIVDEAYLRTVCRYPSCAERKQLLAVLKATPDNERTAAVEDLFWSLLSSREFLFAH